MSALEAVSGYLLAIGDRFLPPGQHTNQSLQRMRVTLVGAGIGLFFSVGTACVYWWAGSWWSSISIHLITAGLLATPFAIRRGISPEFIGNLMVAVTAQSAVVVTWRSGGFASPAASWFFILPLIAYLACGSRPALAWGAFSVLGLSAFFSLDRAGFEMGHDFTPTMLSTLRISGYSAVIVSMVALLVVMEGVRRSSETALEWARRAQERERILRDLHDGIGSQLVGLITRARAGRLENASLVRDLETCFEDLRLVLSSMDPAEPTFEETLGELRSRVLPQAESVGASLRWSIDDTSKLRLPQDETLQVLRAVQEMLSNALRHSRAKHVELRVGVEPGSTLCVSVEDDGVGFNAEQPSRTGRGLASLRARASKLGGSFQVNSSPGATRAEFRFRTESQNAAEGAS